MIAGRMDRRAVRARGFTLIEVIVSIAVFSLLMTILYGAFSTAVRAYDAAEARVASEGRVRVVSAFLRRQVRGAFPLALVKRRDWEMLFEGDSKRLRFVSDLPGYLGLGGMHEMVIEVDRGIDGGKDLVLRRRPLLLERRSSELAGELETRVLLEDVDRMELRYFGTTDPRQRPRWRERWDPGKLLPQLVEISITERDAEPWPLITVRLPSALVRYLASSEAPGGENAPIGAPPRAVSP